MQCVVLQKYTRASFANASFATDFWFRVMAYLPLLPVRILILIFDRLDYFFISFIYNIIQFFHLAKHCNFHTFLEQRKGVSTFNGAKDKKEIFTRVKSH